MKYCFCQISTNLINKDVPDDVASEYYQKIWEAKRDDGYVKPDHFWELPLWIAELSYNIHDEKSLFIIENESPILPDADIYFASVLDCNKEILRKIARDNPEKFFYFGGYIGIKEFYSFFSYPGLTTSLGNVSWCDTIQEVCDAFQIDYEYGLDYSLFAGTECIPRLTLSTGCKHHCRFCSIPDEVIETTTNDIMQQIKAMEVLRFKLVYVNDKTFGQTGNYRHLRYIYNEIKVRHADFEGFIIQTTCNQVLKFNRENVNLYALGIRVIELGIESYNDCILRKYNKPQNTSIIDMAIESLSQRPIKIIPNLIIGLPGETRYTGTDTVLWVLENSNKFYMLNLYNFAVYDDADIANEIQVRENDLNNEVQLSNKEDDTLYVLGLMILKRGN